MTTPSLSTPLYRTTRAANRSQSRVTAGVTQSPCATIAGNCCYVATVWRDACIHKYGMAITSASSPYIATVWHKACLHPCGMPFTAGSSQKSNEDTADACHQHELLPYIGRMRPLQIPSSSSVMKPVQSKSLIDLKPQLKSAVTV